MPVVENDVALAPLTSFELGGSARFYTKVETEAALVDALRWARGRGVRTTILAGGTNVVVLDDGFDGLVVHMALRGLRVGAHGELTVQAGVPWEEVVDEAIARGWAGIECLTGIPGSAGATPIQNVGAYGQRVSDVITGVRVLRTDSLAFEELSPEACRFTYRDSRFKQHPGRWVVCAVEFRLQPKGPPTRTYPEVARAVSETATLDEVRKAVRSLRRRKSMLLDPGDPNHRSAGSFFLNPILPVAETDRLIERARSEGLVSSESEVPRYDTEDGRVKLAAGWLIEKAGFTKGWRHGRVGLSTKHALALVHHGGGTAAELLALADAVRTRVEERFGVRLEREPRLIG